MTTTNGIKLNISDPEILKMFNKAEADKKADKKAAKKAAAKRREETAANRASARVAEANKKTAEEAAKRELEKKLQNFKPGKLTGDRVTAFLMTTFGTPENIPYISYEDKVAQAKSFIAAQVTKIRAWLLLSGKKFGNKTQSEHKPAKHSRCITVGTSKGHRTKVLARNILMKEKYQEFKSHTFCGKLRAKILRETTCSHYLLPAPKTDTPDTTNNGIYGNPGFISPAQEETFRRAWASYDEYSYGSMKFHRVHETDNMFGITSRAHYKTGKFDLQLFAEEDNRSCVERFPALKQLLDDYPGYDYCVVNGYVPFNQKISKAIEGAIRYFDCETSKRYYHNLDELFRGLYAASLQDAEDFDPDFYEEYLRRVDQLCDDIYYTGGNPKNNGTSAANDSQEEGGDTKESASASQQEEGTQMKFKCRVDDMKKLVHEAKTIAFVQAKVAQLGATPFTLYITQSKKVVVATQNSRVVIDGFTAISETDLIKSAIIENGGYQTVDQLPMSNALTNIDSAQIKGIHFDGKTLTLKLKQQVFNPENGTDFFYVYPKIIFDGKYATAETITYADALAKQKTRLRENAEAVANLAKLGKLAKEQAEEETKAQKVGEVHDREHFNKIASETTKNDAGDSIHITGLFFTEKNRIVSKILRQTATPETKSYERYLKTAKVRDNLFYHKVDRYLDQKITVTFATAEQFAALIDGNKFRTFYRVGDRFFWYDADWTKLFIDMMTHEKLSSKQFWALAGESRTCIVFDGSYTTASAGNQKNKTIELNGRLMSKDIAYVKKHGVPWAQISNNYMNGAWQMAKFYEELGYRGTFEDNCKTPIRMTQSKPARRQFLSVPHKIGVDFKGLGADGNVIARASWGAKVLSTEWRKISAESLVGKTYQMRSILGLKVTVTFFADEAFDVIEGRRKLVKNWDLETMSSDELKENMFFGCKDHNFGEDKRPATLKGEYHTFVTKSEYLDDKTDLIVDMDGNKIAGLIENMEQGFGFLSQIADEHEDGVLSSQAERTLDLYMGRYAFEFLTSKFETQVDKAHELLTNFRRRKISQKELREGFEEIVDIDTGAISKRAADINWADLATKVAPDTVFSTIPRALLASYNQELKKLLKMLNHRNYPVTVKHFMMQVDPCVLLFGIDILGVDENGFTEMFINDLPDAKRKYGNIDIEKIAPRIRNLDKDAWGNPITDEEKEIAINCYKQCHYGQVIVSANMYLMKALEGYDFDGDSLYVYVFEDVPMGEKTVSFKIAIRYPKTHLMGAAILAADKELLENEYFKTVCVDIRQDKLGKKISPIDYQFATAHGIGSIATAINAAIGTFNEKNENIKEILGGENGKEYTIRSILGLDSSRMGVEGSFNYAIQCAKQVGEVINSFTPLVDLLIYVKLLEDDEKFTAAFRTKNGDISIAQAWKTLKLTQADFSKKNMTVQASWRKAVEALAEKGDYYSWLAVTNIVQTIRAIFKVKPYIGMTSYEISHNTVKLNSEEATEKALEGSKYDNTVAYENAHNNYTESCLEYIKAARETQNMDVYRVNLSAAEKAIRKCWRQVQNQNGEWIPVEGYEGLNNRLWLSQVKLMAMDFNAIIRFYGESTIDQVKKPVANAILGIMNECELRCSRLMSKRITLSLRLSIEEDEKGVKQFVGQCGAVFDGKSTVRKYDKEDYALAKSLSTLMLKEKDDGAYKAQIRDICYEQTVKDVAIVEKFAKDGLTDLKTRKFEMPIEFVNTCLRLIYAKIGQKVVLSDAFVSKIYATFDVLQRMWRNANTAVRLMEEELAAQKISESSDTWKAQMDTIKARKRIVFKEIINTAYCAFEAAGVTNYLEKNAYVWISSAIGTKLWKENIPVKQARAMLTTNMNTFNTSFLGPDYLRFILALADMRHRADESVLETAAKTFDRLYLTGWKHLEDIAVLDGAQVMVKNGTVTYQGKSYGYVKDTEMNGIFSVYVDTDENGKKVPYIVENIDKLLPETKGDFSRTVIQLHAYTNLSGIGQVPLNADETLAKVAGQKVFLVFTDMDERGKYQLKSGAKSIYDELARKQSLMTEKEAGLFIIENGEPIFLGSIQGCTFRSDDCAPALRNVYGCKHGIMEGVVEMGMKSAWFKKNDTEIDPEDYENMTKEEIEKAGYETVTSCILCLSEFKPADKNVEKLFADIEAKKAKEAEEAKEIWKNGTVFRKTQIPGYNGTLLVDETQKYVFTREGNHVKGYQLKETWAKTHCNGILVDFTIKVWNARIQ